MEEIKLRLSDDLKKAMKEKNTIAVKAIRSLVAAIDNAGAVIVEAPATMPMSGGIAGATSGLGSTEVERKKLSDDDIRIIIQKEIEEIQKAIESINDHSRTETKELFEQIKVLSKYL